MNIETLFEVCKWGFSIFIVIWCFLNMFAGLKDITEINNIMKDKLYEEYLVWLKQTHNITPDDKYMGVNALEELKTMRDESMGLLGETQLVIMMKEEGSFEKTKNDWKTKYSILTFDEYKNSKQK